MECEFAVVGAGPAGLSAAIEAAKAGARTAVIDENAKPGGQLFKQIHKFFGGKEHRAGTRGIDIGNRLLEEARNAGVEVVLNTAVWGIFDDGNVVCLYSRGKVQELHAKKILLATGASENPLSFPGHTLPGVLGAGAAQTMVNLHRVSVGERVLMIGSGNVGLIVSYQLMQAGATVVAVVEVLPKIGGYGVHASKIARLGIPILTSHTVKEVRGHGKVEAATVAKVDSKFQTIAGTERDFDVDTVCIAVGLSPLAELAWMCGCDFMYIPEMGGYVPVHDENMETTIPGIYVAGDAAGIEEAATAMVDGALAGLAVAQSLGHLSREKFQELKADRLKSAEVFRQRRFEFRKAAKVKLTGKERRVRQWLKG